MWNSPIKFSDPTGLDGWGNDKADSLDEKIEYARQFYQRDVQNWGWNGSVNTVAGLAFGVSDLLRVGSGTGHALYDCDDNAYGRAANVMMDVGRASGIFTLLAGPATRFLPKELPQFSGTSKPWTKGATPDSVYTHIDPKTGKALQNAVYDSNGDVIGHVDFKNHGGNATSGHGHKFSIPGDPSSGHGANYPHIPYNQLPKNWVKTPNGVQPRIPIGQ